MKICSKCKKKKDLSFFGKDITHKDNLSSACKVCRNKWHQNNYKKNKEKYKEKYKQYYVDNREKCNKYQKKYRQENKEEIKKYKKEYFQSNKKQINENRQKWYQNNNEEAKRRIRIYREKNKEKIQTYQKNYRKEYYEKNKKTIIKRQLKNKKSKRKIDLSYRIIESLRSRLLSALKGKNKSAHTMELLGCSSKELKQHLESQFTAGMSWNNYGYYGWHVDHIIPCSSFNLINESQQKICFNYKNLQPLWAKDNMSKGNRITL